MQQHLKRLPLLLALAVAANAHAQSENNDGARLYEEILVTGGKEGIRTLAGSATLIDEEAIAQFDITDVNALLARVPGVYIRYEDGYGLRPNIGIRGATSDRSQKITLMEDGILIAPAPYSAPAAYYVPNVNRMSAVEVFKGPAAIAYGPHTVGGAMNMATPAVPTTTTGKMQLTYGSYDYRKARLMYGDGGERMGYWIDATRYGADGFKELDNGGDTGFTRNDINAKWQWRSAKSASVRQTLQVKLGYADEVSDETYLGLTDDDFAENPNRRYIASELDQFESEHSQVHVLHLADFNNGWQLNTKAYVNRFDRAWNKFDGFLPLSPEGFYQQRLSAADIFNPELDIDPIFLALVRGERNSDGSLGQTLDVTENARQYGSQGIESIVTLDEQWGAWQHSVDVGVRLHQDYVERDHSVRGYHSIDGTLVPDGVDAYSNKSLNKAETDAIALFVNDELIYNNWTINVGVRHEQIEGTLHDYLRGTRETSSESVWIPGAGVFYQWTDSLGFLLGVNRGFSPNGPGSSDEVDPEMSVNYEYGLRFRRGEFNVDAIGFFSDYSNLIGRCRVSDAGCNADEEFNGGDVHIAGLELTADYVATLGGGLHLPVALVYTYSESAFQNSFASDFSQWGRVTEGDQLPYLPEHQARLDVGLQGLNWTVDLALKYVGKMRELPSQGAYIEGRYTNAYTTADIAVGYEFSERWSAQLVGENLANTQEIVSRKPFGARPNAPRTVKAGVTYAF